MSELSELVSLLGQEAAFILMDMHAGTRISIPKVIPADHPLRAALGDEATALLTTYYAGSMLLVPMARSWRAPIYRAKGLTFREMAKRLGCSEKAAYQYMAAKGDDRQMALPLS
jgi:hypothetical protein